MSPNNGSSWTPSCGSFVEHCSQLACTQPTKVAYTWLRDGEVEEAQLTFAQLDSEARRVAALLDARGLRGQRAALVYSPGLEFIAAFLGCLYAGVVAVPLSAPRGERGAKALAGIAAHAGPSIWLTDAGVVGVLTKFADLLGANEIVATDALPTGGAEGWSPEAIEPSSLAFVQYTSGSTGSPKGVEVTHANLIRNEEMIRDGFGHDQTTVFVGWLPLFHDMGLVGNVLQPLFLGVQSVLMAPTSFVQKPVRWLRAITRYGGTTSGSPNFGYELCVQRVRPEQLEGIDLSSWKVAYNGSEPVRAQTMERFIEKFTPSGFEREAFYPCYGMAEAALFVTGGRSQEPFKTLDVDVEQLKEHIVEVTSPDDAARRRLVSCGRPWLDQRVIVVDPGSMDARDAHVLADRLVGEIWIQGGNVARGYRDFPADQENPFGAYLASGEGPFLRTGDLGFLSEGELYVTGRLKDVLIQNGQNHYPQDVELTSGASHPSLRLDHAAAFTVEEDDLERLVVVQEVDRRHGRPLEAGGPAGEVLRSELVGAVRAAIARAHGLSAWKVLLVKHASIPHTSSGKVQRRKCRRLWREGELAELVPQTATDSNDATGS